MTSFHNIEKSGFRKGEYVGYCDGAWNIWKSDSGWTCRHQKTFTQFRRNTLADVSAELDARSKDGRGSRLLPYLFQMRA